MNLFHDSIDIWQILFNILSSISAVYICFDVWIRQIKAKEIEKLAKIRVYEGILLNDELKTLSIIKNKFELIKRNIEKNISDYENVYYESDGYLPLDIYKEKLIENYKNYNVINLSTTDEKKIRNYFKLLFDLEHINHWDNTDGINRQIKNVEKCIELLKSFES